MNQLTEIFGQREQRFEDTRDFDLVLGKIIGELATNKNISGDQDLVIAIYAITKEMLQNEKFKDALTVIAETMLRLFPRGDE